MTKTETSGDGFTVGDPPGDTQNELPKIDFSTFVLSLATSALYHLGLIAEPETGKPGQKNLPMARHSIDTLELLEQKTQGNLTAEEAELLAKLLTELRVHYVEASRA